MRISDGHVADLASSRKRMALLSAIGGLIVLASFVLGSLFTLRTNREVQELRAELLARDLPDAVQAAAIAVHNAYGRRLPADFDARAYLAAARAYPLLDSQLAVLQSVDLEVWTKSNCEGAMVIARRRDTHRVILIDDTASMSVVDQPNALADPQVKVPARPDPPPTCPLPTNP